jgi:hypothetical protein
MTAGFSHSEISGSKRICRSPKLIAAYHVLHRLVSPRHPLIARNSLHCRFLTLKDKYSSRVVLFYYSLFLWRWTVKEQKLFCFLSILVTTQWWALVDSNHRPPRYQHDALTNWAKGPKRGFEIWGRDLRSEIKIWVSNGIAWLILVEPDGFEPTTSCLQSRRSTNWAMAPFESY